MKGKILIFFLITAPFLSLSAKSLPITEKIAQYDEEIYHEIFHLRHKSSKTFATTISIQKKFENLQSRKLKVGQGQTSTDYPTLALQSSPSILSTSLGIIFPQTKASLSPSSTPSLAPSSTPSSTPSSGMTAIPSLQSMGPTSTTTSNPSIGGITTQLKTSKYSDQAQDVNPANQNPDSSVNAFGLWGNLPLPLLSGALILQMLL